MEVTTVEKFNGQRYTVKLTDDTIHRLAVLKSHGYSTPDIVRKAIDELTLRLLEEHKLQHERA